MCKRSTFLFSLVLVLYWIVSAPANLVGHWEFEGDFRDAVGNNDATAYGDTVIVPDPERGRVAEFDGTGDYLQIPNSPSLNITGEEITLASWVYFDDVSGPPEIVIAKPFLDGQHSSPYFSYGLHMLSNGTPRFWLSLSAGARNAPGSPNFESGRWYHMAGVYDGSQMILYVDGEVSATNNNVSGNLNGYDTPLFLGTNGGRTEPMDGKIDDVRIYNHALDQVDIQAIMLQIGGGYPYAMGPNPKDGAIHEDTWVNLSWRAGDYVVSHDVYLGDDSDVVENATRDSDEFRGNQITTFYVAGFPGFAFPKGLVPGTTYYWRIDEVNDTDPNSPWKGPVWSFSIPPKTAYNPDPADGAGIAETTVNLTWTAGFGAKLHTIYFGDDFDTVANATVGMPAGTASHNPGPLEAEKVYYWRVDEFDGLGTYKGGVWAFTTPGAVGNPQPANGAADVTMATVLSWTAADNAASHEVYLGLDKDTVRSADTTSPEYKGPKALGAESYDAGLLEPDMTYYWRIDEVYTGNTVKGPVWSFTVGAYLLVEDFESYTDDDAAGEAIWQTWVDGFGVADNGAQVGYLMPSYAEQTIVHGGGQSLPLLYVNEAGVTNSEASLSLTAPRDWTTAGVGELSLWFRGDSANVVNSLYVAISNSAGAPAIIANDDLEASVKTAWKKWAIPLQAVADQGINLGNVDKIAVGLGSKGGAMAGGTGTMYIDDIRLYRADQ
ncbi:LamG-like jellyroll fold domain-containing protein [Planctomycetota bacterium]